MHTLGQIYLHIWDISIYRSTYSTHIDRSICYGLDLSHIGLPEAHIRIGLSAYMG